MSCVADDLGFSQTQLKSIGMLVHALYNNPKVLYAPNNSAANLIISKVIFLDVFITIQLGIRQRICIVFLKY